MPTAQDLGEHVAITLEGLALSESSMRCTIIWAGQEYPCVGGPEFGGKTIDEGGFRMQAKCKVKVRNEVFDGGPTPEEKQTLLYKRSKNSEPVRYLIDAKTNYFDAFMELELNAITQGS